MSDLVNKSKEENEVLSKVLESVTKECETLKDSSSSSKSGGSSTTNSRRSSSSTASSNKDYEDKIQALRNTCKALEVENELIVGKRINATGMEKNGTLWTFLILGQ